MANEKTNLTVPLPITNVGNLVAPLTSSEIGWQTQPRPVSDLMACVDNVSEVAAAIQRRTAGVLANPISYLFDENDSRAAAACELVKDQLENIPRLNFHLKELLTGKAYGLGALELMWERQGAGMRLTGMSEIDIRYLGRNAKGEIFLREYQSNYPERNADFTYGSVNSIIPDGKLCLLSTSQRALRGRAYLDRAYIPARSLFLVCKFWLMTTERFGSPTIVGERTGTSNGWEGTDAEETKMWKALQSIRANGVIELPPGYNVRLLEADLRGASAGLFKDLSESLAKSVRKLILSSDLTMDGGTQGSRSLGEVQERGEDDVIAEDAQDLEDCWQNQVVNRILEYNGYEPDIVHVEISVQESVDLMQRADFVKAVQGIGIDQSKAHVRSFLGDIPDAENADDLLPGNGGNSNEPPLIPADEKAKVLAIETGKEMGKAFYQLAMFGESGGE